MTDPGQAIERISWRRARKLKTLVVLSQVYVPDPTSVGQHMHDVARAMAQRGWRVVVFTADRGYEDPERVYPAREMLDGVEVRRLGHSSFGKSSIALRLAGGAAFLAQAVSAALALPRVDRVLVSTSPPIGGLGGLALARLRGVPLTFWAMDINPDQIVATGALAPRALPVRAFDWMNRRVLGGARHVVALDRYMAARLEQKRALGEKLAIVPPWPLVDTDIPRLPHPRNAFRAQHGFRSQRVVMYSGNLSPTHPLTTLLEAARVMRREPRLLFVFVGGGLGRAEIERFVREHALENVVSLPYQPLALLHSSLSAADVHLVSMGDAMVGIVHPCKIYGAMAVGRPIFVLGPAHSHVADLVQRHGIGWHVTHGDVGGAVRVLEQIAAAPEASLEAMGARAHEIAAQELGRERLCAEFCAILESE